MPGDVPLYGLLGDILEESLGDDRESSLGELGPKALPITPA